MLPVLWSLRIGRTARADRGRAARPPSYDRPHERIRRATITLPDDLEQALQQFVDEQAVPVQPTAVVQAAVREYLGERGYLPSTSTLRIRPAKRGSGNHDGSLSHDRYLSAQ